MHRVNYGELKGICDIHVLCTALDREICRRYRSALAAAREREIGALPQGNPSKITTDVRGAIIRLSASSRTLPRERTNARHKDRDIDVRSEDPFGVSPECFAAEQLAFVQIREYPKGVIRCAYEQLPPPWWSLRLFLSLKLHPPQPVGRGRGYGYAAAGYAAPRYGYMSYGYSSPAYYGGYGGYYGGYGGYGIGRGIARRNIRRAAYGGIGYRGGVGVRRGLGRWRRPRWTLQIALDNSSYHQDFFGGALAL